MAKSKRYALASSHVVGPRPPLGLEHILPAKREWVIDKVFGTHPTRVAAKYAWLKDMRELNDPPYTEDFINSYFAPFQRQGLVKVIPVEET